MGSSEDLEIPLAQDGQALAATLFLPEGPPRAAVLLASAMGVQRGFYAPFALHLAEGGFAALTFDYRGIGGSACRPLRDLKVSLQDWAADDIPAALEALAARCPDAPLWYVGHSVGGQLLGLVPNRDRVRAALLVAAQVGYWRRWPGLGRAGMWLLWHAGIPLLTRALGYFPMGRVGMGEDLPGGVARQWARWGRHPEYLFGHLQQAQLEGYAHFDRPLLSLAIADDGYAPVPTVQALFDRYGVASGAKELRIVDPSAAGLRKLGHFGFFRSRASGLWREPLAWLQEHGSAASR